MILQSLVSYYEALCEKGEISKPGWADVKVSYALEIDDDGKLLDIHNMKIANSKGKLLPDVKRVPATPTRSSGVNPAFLCDNESYFLCYDLKGKPKRTEECFNAAKQLHKKILSSLDIPAAKAIINYFDNYTLNKEIISRISDDLKTGANFVFMYCGVYAQDVPEIRTAWQKYYDGNSEETTDEGQLVRCLVTGEKTVPEKTHPVIKGIAGAQMAGAAIVSFNATAFCSYAHDGEQNVNSPMSKYSAFAYTTALNYLISDFAHKKQIGEMTLVYWAQDANENCRILFSGMYDADDKLTDENLNELMKKLALGKSVEFNGCEVSPDDNFYILGISPNAARLSIRLFLHNSFGNIVNNLKKHYDRIYLPPTAISPKEMLSVNNLLSETYRHSSKGAGKKTKSEAPSPQMTGDTVRAILSDTMYPATLFNSVMIRIRAEKNVNRAKAEIIKAYLIKNKNDKYKEATTMALNENCNDTPYVLGRLFSVLENIQDSATGASTVKDRFFTSACTTPAAVFPQLLRLSGSHMKVLNRDNKGAAVNLDKLLLDLMSRLDTKFPNHLTLDEQGVFMLGYYHQTQKRYEKKTETKTENN